MAGGAAGADGETAPGSRRRCRQPMGLRKQPLEVNETLSIVGWISAAYWVRSRESLEWVPACMNLLQVERQSVNL
jgi:hypothetical protein